MNNKVKGILFRTAMFILYFCHSVGYCLMVNFLTSLQYSATERGIILSVGALIAFVVQFVIGYLCDKLKTIKLFAIITDIIFAIVIYFFYHLEVSNFAYHLIMGALLIVNIKVCAGLIDSWVLESGQESKTKYGIIRAYGSIGWAVGSLVLGVSVDKFGYQSVPLLFGVSTALLVVISMFTEDAIKDKTEKVSVVDIKYLLSKKTYVMAVFALFFLFFMAIGNDYAVVDKMNFLKASEADVSLNWAITALVELPLFFLGNKLLEKFGLEKLLFSTTIFYFIRYILYSFSTSVLTMHMISLIQAVTFPVMLVISKEIIDRESKSNIKSSAQQIGMAIYCTGSSLICPLFIGLLEDNLGINNMLVAMACCSIGTIIFTLLYIKNKKGN